MPYNLTKEQEEKLIEKLSKNNIILRILNTILFFGFIFGFVFSSFIVLPAIFSQSIILGIIFVCFCFTAAKMISIWFEYLDIVADSAIFYLMHGKYECYRGEIISFSKTYNNSSKFGIKSKKPYYITSVLVGEEILKKVLKEKEYEI